MDQPHHRIALAHRVDEEIGGKVQISRDRFQNACTRLVEGGEHFKIGFAKAVQFLWPDIGGHIGFEPVTGRQLPADMPEFLEILDIGILGALRPERGVAASPAAAGDVIGALHILGQREKDTRHGLRTRDQLGRDAMVGNHRKAPVGEAATDAVGKAIGILVGQGERNGG